MKEICKGCKKFGVRKGCYRGCDSMPKNNLKDNPMKSKTLQKKIEKLEIEPNIVEVGTEWSSGGNVEEGLKSFNSLEGYKDRILKYGIYAVAISYISENK